MNTQIHDDSPRHETEDQTTVSSNQARELLSQIPLSDQYVQGFWNRWRVALKDQSQRARCIGSAAGILLGMAAIAAGLIGLGPVSIALGVVLVVAALLPPRRVNAWHYLIRQARTALDDGNNALAFETLTKVESPRSEMLLAACALWPLLPAEDPHAAPEGLRGLLETLPLDALSRGVTLATQGSEERAALFFSELAPPLTPGLHALLRDLAERWLDAGRWDEVARSFYQALLRHRGVSDYTDWLIARILVEQGRDGDAEPLLRELADRGPTPDVLFVLAGVLQRLGRSPEEAIATFRRFIASSPTDARVSQAWVAIADLYASLRDGTAVVRAYQEANAFGVEFPEGKAYRLGNWEEIAALQIHPDARFPTVVTVDLEADPAPGAAWGERVYEVAAVRSKGRTILEEFHSFVQRDFRPAKVVDTGLLASAPRASDVADALNVFIGDALLAGHNLRDFDAHHLRALGVSVCDETLIDTLTLARLLYPDSLYHNLGILCDAHGVELGEDERHTALPDARACAQLLVHLGDEFVRRDGAFLEGCRALAHPGSAFDQVVLQPRDQAADPTVRWRLDPAPSPPRPLMVVPRNQASPAMCEAVTSEQDALVEHDDRNAAYAASLPLDRRAVVAVGTHQRLDRVLATLRGADDLFVLPHPRTLLCPQRLQPIIAGETDPERRLLLFCLYQASHNHDAATLFPFRIPLATPDLVALRRDLLRACCPNEFSTHDCLAWEAVSHAISTHRILLSTHEALLAQSAPPPADLIVIEDADMLTTGIAEHLAERIDRDLLESLQTGDALDLLDEAVTAFAREFLPLPGFRERVPLRNFLRVLRYEGPAGEPPVLERILSTLADRGGAGRAVAEQLERVLLGSRQEPENPDFVHAHWLDMWFREEQSDHRVERWALCGLSTDPSQAFQRTCWEPYQQHIICGPAVLLAGDASFLERTLGIPPGIRRIVDERPRKDVVLLSPQVLPPAGFLNRRSWAVSAGLFLYSRSKAGEQTVLVSLNAIAISDSMAAAFGQASQRVGRQVLSTRGGWTTSKIAERIGDPQRRTLTFVSPRTRRNVLDVPVDVEITGPLRFLNQRDPLVGAQMRSFRSRYPKEGPFDAYLRPQAFLELKARLSSAAAVHVVLESGILEKGYRDEVLAVLGECANIQRVERLPELDDEGREFLDRLSEELARRGLGARAEVSDADLRLILRTLWDAEDFRSFPGSGLDGEKEFSQKDIIRGVLQGKDHLVIVATGGGKSLCFQLPAIILAEETPPKVTLVFSPLIALMANQVEELNRRGIFSAILMNSTLSPPERAEHLRGLTRGDYSIVYLAPEQIHSPSLRRALESREIGLIAVDEAHCLSQWGHDFRTDYFVLKKWIDTRLARNPKRAFPIIALTATARAGHIDPEDPTRSDEASTVEDIIGKLGLRRDKLVCAVSTTRRPQLRFRVEHIVPGPIQCERCRTRMRAEPGMARCPACGSLRRVSDADVRAAVEAGKLERLVSLHLERGSEGLRERWDAPNGTRQRGLVYCAYRRTTEQVVDVLSKRVRGLRVAFYHAGMDAPERDEVLRRFTSDEADGLDVVVATNAFGMGIDVRRLGFVIHFDAPGTLEAYYQEAGRAGRDSMFTDEHPAQCILLYHPNDLQKQRFLSRQNIITLFEVQDVYEALRDLAHSAQSRNGTELEVIAAEQDIATLAAVGEEKVKTILYYLEHHTLANASLVLERDETANRVWRLRFEFGCEERVTKLPATSSSRPLLELFLNSDEFGLRDDAPTAIALGELAASLKWPYARIESEILNLARRHIVTYGSEGRIRWAVGAQHAKETLDRLQSDLVGLLQHLYRQQRKRLLAGHTVYVDLGSLDLKAVSLQRFAHFLFALAREDAEPLRVFERFARAIRSTQPHRYELRLWEGRGNRRINTIVSEIFAGLHEVVGRLAGLKVTGEWQRFDLYQVEPEYQARQALHRRLVLLHVLGLIGYVGDPALGLALKIRLKQPHVGPDELEIDLTPLRLKETYEKHKLRLIEEYAGLRGEEERAAEFERYFFAEHPLIERVEAQMREDMTGAQREVITCEGGSHLVEGPAGCGKTTALVEHIKYLVYQRHVPLDRIMVTTHFNSAVGRIEKQLEVLREDGAITLTTTINSFGNRIFRKHRSLLRRADGRPYYTREPGVLAARPTTEREETPLISQALARVHAGSWVKEGWPQDLPLPEMKRPYTRNAEIESLCWKAISRFRQYGIFPSCTPTGEQIRRALGDGSNRGPLGQRSDPEYNSSVFYAVYLIHLQLMGERGNYTYDDQVLFALAILRTNPDILREYRRFFEHVIVDELQDFTPAAAELFRVVSGIHQNVMAFGDRDQSIRVMDTSAEAVFADFRQGDSCGRSHRLTTNFRSTQEILDLAVAIRDYGEPDSKKLGPLIARRGSSGQKPVFLDVETSAEISTKRALGEMVDVALERIKWPERSDGETVALIAAKSGWQHPLEQALMEREIPFSVLENKTKYQLRHVDNVLVLYRLILDPDQDEDVSQLLRYCLVPYVENSQITLLQDIAKAEECSLITILDRPDVLDAAQFTEEQRATLSAHLEVIRRFTAQSRSGEVEQVIREIEAGQFSSLKDQPDKLEDVDRVFQDLRQKTVEEVIETVNRHIAFLEANRGNTGLVLTTIDNAKSEEFDTVFILGANHLYDKNKLRLYVSMSRARDRLFILCDKAQGWTQLLSSIPRQLYEREEWRFEPADAREEWDDEPGWDEIPF